MPLVKVTQSKFNIKFSNFYLLRQPKSHSNCTTKEHFVHLLPKSKISVIMVQLRLILILFIASFVFDSGAQTTKKNSTRSEVVQISKDIDTKKPSDSKGDLCVPNIWPGRKMNFSFIYTPFQSCGIK